jgi:predicted nucleic acid-binding protein
VVVRSENAAGAGRAPADTAVLGVEEATVAARLYHSISKTRGREVDLAIAACALANTAALNPSDFSNVPKLRPI